MDLPMVAGRRGDASLDRSLAVGDGSGMFRTPDEIIPSFFVPRVGGVEVVGGEPTERIVVD
jgi:hypothetical protein